MAGPYRWDGVVFHQGDTWRRVFAVDQDLTGWTGHMQLRHGVDGAGALVELTTANGAVVIAAGATPGTSTITLTITDEQTALLPVAQLNFDLFVTPPSGAAWKAFYGVAPVVARVTR